MQSTGGTMSSELGFVGRRFWFPVMGRTTKVNIDTTCFRINENRNTDEAISPDHVQNLKAWPRGWRFGCFLFRDRSRMIERVKKI